MSKRIVGYANKISAQPGESLDFMVSCYGIAEYSTEVVRLIHGDLNPEGPGFKSELVSEITAQNCPGREQIVHCGSYGIVPSLQMSPASDGLTIQAFIYPTTPAKGAQAIISTFAPDGESGFELQIDESGCLAMLFGTTSGVITISTNTPLVSRQWYLVAATYDAGTGTVSVYQDPIDSSRPLPVACITGSAAVNHASSSGPLLFAARNSGTVRGKQTASHHYNGKLERPRIASQALSRSEIETLSAPQPPGLLYADVIGAWDFSRHMSGLTITDISPNESHGVLVNLPARAMKGVNWTGESMSWKDRPEHYGAIHFHDDDVYDASWDVDFTVTLPENLRSGIYAAHLVSGDAEDYIPFVVRPMTSGPKADIVFVLPTTSYLAYANEHMPTDAPLAQLLTDQVLPLQEEDLFLAEHREFGGSTYDTHSDGSGICYSSRLRPVLNMRPKYANWLGGSGSALWQFNADLHITDWLEAKGFTFDVITDEDLHAGGASALAPYRVAITGTHPEYTSNRMRLGYETFINRGGRMVYMGGNGFYWRTSYSDELPGVIEVRKGEGGIRAWAAEPGEYYNSFTGEYSGLWRRSGQPPQQLVGVGFTAQGFDVSSCYRRQPGSFDDRAAFIVEGIGENEKLGDFGLVGGGAAGLELDRADVLLGTPPHALVLASSEAHTDIYMVVLEEILINSPGLTGTQSPLVRADMTFFETPSGGAVFSTGSIAYCGSLSHNNYDNNISRITENVIKRFADPKPFEVPAIDRWPSWDV